jgi:hypothetical protein
MSKSSCLLLLLAIIFCSANQQSIIVMENTKWLYTDANQSYELDFISEGRLISHHPEDRTPINDEWKLKKDKLIFYYNDHYIKHKGKFVHPDTIKGYVIDAEGRIPFMLVRSEEKLKL